MCRGDLDFLLQDFIFSVRKENKEEYPPSSLRSLVSGIISYFRNTHSRNWDFFKDNDFSKSRQVLDAKMRNLTRRGIGTMKRKATPISTETEADMWSKGILGSDTPTKLVHTVLYLIGIQFALRSRDEHRHLRFGLDSQLQFGIEDGTEFLSYREDCSKTRQGGIKDRFKEAKECVVYSNGMVDSEKDLVQLYKKYCSHRPKSGKSNAFYLKPMNCPTNDIWYCDQPMGVNTISKVVANLTKLCGVSGHYTNHSLRRTAVSRLNQSGFGIEEVKKRTGHKTNEGVMSYDVSNKKQIAAQCAALYGMPESENLPSTSNSALNMNFERTSEYQGIFYGAKLSKCTININFH